MDNEIRKEKSWLAKNWKWLTPLSVIVVITVVLISSLLSAGNIFGFASAFSEDKLYKVAIEQANKNAEVQNVLGRLEPVDNMAILESTVEYTNNKNNVNLSVRVLGTRDKAKMDIKATKRGREWKYDLIKLRIKNTGQEIIVSEK